MFVIIPTSEQAGKYLCTSILSLDKEIECYNIKHAYFGTWRSLEAHLNGVQGARGSNPRVPTINFNKLGLSLEGPFCYWGAVLFPIYSPLKILKKTLVGKYLILHTSLSDPKRLEWIYLQGKLRNVSRLWQMCSKAHLTGYKDSPSYVHECSSVNIEIVKIRCLPLECL